MLIDAQSVNARYSDYSHDTLLHKATKNIYCNIVNELLIHHAEVNSQDKDGTTPLMETCYLGHYKIVKELLNPHADVNI